MSKYLIEANYVGDGLKGLLNEGGSRRGAAVAKAVQSVGGTVEGFYYAFGDTDAYLIMEMPDNASMAALALTVAATGLVTIKTTVLMTAEELDEAIKKTPQYRGPGQ